MSELKPYIHGFVHGLSRGDPAVDLQSDRSEDWSSNILTLSYASSRNLIADINISVYVCLSFSDIVTFPLCPLLEVNIMRHYQASQMATTKKLSDTMEKEWHATEQ